MDGESHVSVCQCVCQSCCGHCVVSDEWTVSRTGPSVSVCVSRTVATVWCPVRDGESDGSVCQCVCQSCCGHCVVSGEWTVSRTCPTVSACVSRTVVTVWCPVSGR